MLEQFRTHTKPLLLIYFLASFIGLAFTILVSPTVKAADYPNAWCKFQIAANKSTLMGDCTDNRSNGSFEGVAFEKTGVNTYSFTDSFWIYYDHGFPKTSHRKFTETLPGGATPTETKCEPAIIKISSDEKSASISGQYASIPESSPSPALQGTWQCTDLLEGEVTINKNLIRLATWRDTLYNNLAKSIPSLECKNFTKDSDSYNACVQRTTQAVKNCVGPSGSVWTNTISYATGSEQKKAHRESTVTCLNDKLSNTSKKDIEEAVRDAEGKADNEENKIEDTTGPTSTETTEEDVTSCAIDGVGWLVCPVVTFIGLLNDALYTVIKQFLEIQPSMFKADSDTYRAWSTIRNIANIAFVIAFLIIIYSQMTGAGVSNYGIKKMMPKLIIAAILVNVSFWICAIAVDLSNILGSSLYNLLQGAIGGSSTNTGLGSPVNSWSDVIVWVLSGGAVAGAGIAAAITVGSVGFFGALSLLLPGAIVVLLAFFTVVVLLIARQAFIILLVVVAPLAFVAYLLPNTDQWFQRWRKFLTTLLIMYPSIALLFGGSELAAAVIRAADPENAWLVIGSLVVTALPLFALPALMKAAGGIMNRIGGIVNNPNRGPLDRMKKGAERYRKQQQGFRMQDNINRTNSIRDGQKARRTLGGVGTRRRRAAAWLSGIGNTNAADAAEKDKYAEASGKSAMRDYVAKRALGDDEYAASLVQANGLEGDEKRAATAQVKAYSKQAVEEATVKDIKAEEVLLKGAGVDALFKTLTDTSASAVTRAAALNKIYQSGGDQHIHEALDYVAKSTGQKDMSEIMQYTGEALGRRKPAAMGGTELSNYSEGSWNGNAGGYENMLLKRIQAGKIGEKEWGSMGADELLRAAKVVHQAGQNGTLTQEQFNKIRGALDATLSNENIQTSPEQKAIIDSLRQAQAHPSTLQNQNFADPSTINR